MDNDNSIFSLIFFQVCKSYPEAVVVPACVSDGILKYSAVFRQGGRFPVLSYRHHTGVSTSLYVSVVELINRSVQTTSS